MKTKVCRTCQEEKNITEFKVTNKKKKLSNNDIKVYTSINCNCIECYKEKSKTYYLKIKGSSRSDIKVLDTMIKIYKERGLNDILEAFKVIGKKELKQLAYERLNK